MEERGKAKILKSRLNVTIIPHQNSLFQCGLWVLYERDKTSSYRA